MNAFIQDNLFVIFLVIGAILLTIRAGELYATSDDKATWMTDEFSLQYFTGKLNYSFGFLCYLLPVLLVYLLFSVSPDILQVTMGIAGTTASVGALPVSESDVQMFAPILAATALITLFSVAPFSKVEQAWRRIAHGIAGIPQYSQHIVRLLRVKEFRHLHKDPSEQTVRQAWSVVTPGLHQDLAAVMVLHEWIYGPTGMRIWSENASRARELARTRILTEFAFLQNKIGSRNNDNNADARNSDQDNEDFAELVRLAHEVRLCLMRLLAVMVTNQHERLPDDAPAFIETLVKGAQNRTVEYRYVNVFVVSALIGLLPCLAVVTLYYYTITTYHDLQLVNMSVDESDNVYVRGVPLSAFYWSSLIESARVAWWDVLGIWLLFFTGCGTALIYRCVSKNRSKWTLWHSRHQPTLQFVAVAILATVSAALVYECFLFFKLVAWPSFQVRTTDQFASMLKDFGGEYLVYGLLAIVVAPSAVLICLLSERLGAPSEEFRLLKEPETRLILWFAMLGSSIAYLCVSLLIGEQQTLRSLIGQLIVPVFCLVSLSYLYWRIGDYLLMASSFSFNTRPDHIALDSKSGGGDTAGNNATARGSEGGTVRGTVSRSRSMLILSIVGLTSLLVAAILVVPAPAFAQELADAHDKIVVDVGVREDARPFSYRKRTRASERILPGFGGYTIEVCRHVLREMQLLPQYRNLVFRGKPTTPNDRFRSLGQPNGLFMLCGPDSITLERLEEFRASHPVFLSGMTYAYINPRSPKFPRGGYCDNIIGVVRGTTADSVGIADIAAQNVLMRFDNAVELDLILTHDRLLAARNELETIMDDVIAEAKSKKNNNPKLDNKIKELETAKKEAGGLSLSAAVNAMSDDGISGVVKARMRDRYAEINRMIARKIVTAECPQGFTSLPIRKFFHHNEGIEAFCKGRVLYYLADYDILSNKIKEFGQCDVLLNRFTRSREVYGVFFPKTINGSKNDAGGCENKACGIDVARFYSTFNNKLLIAMQGRVSDIEEIFAMEFSQDAITEELKQFFDSFKISSYSN